MKTCPCCKEEVLGGDGGEELESDRRRYF